MERLGWAHAVYWSRAIVLPLRGGARACLVPLLDMANHRQGAGVASKLSLESADTGGGGGVRRR